ncbi:MAG: hypothetical protein V2I57_10395 [Xanthomonadales bacterium]|jgi:TolB-like protein/Flp pilus assembly protein TadD|nr:hypothetical protein [Xanthomonadales bacterium]
MSFFEELKRRKVIRVAIAYVIGAWLLLQLAEVLSELLSLPETMGPIVVGLVALGLPVVIVLAWVYELTADGLKRDSEVAPSERGSGKVINVVVIGLLAAALGYFVWESRFRDAAPAPPERTSTALTNVAGQSIETPRIGRSIAVLPFENFSGNPEDSYFADGLSDTLLHQLAQIEELKVIARNSSFQYKGSNRDVREIGAELGVETILEGSVQRAGDRVRIIAQLVQASDGAHVWSRTFDGSMDDIFALQDQVAADVVDAFQISLSAAEREQLMRDGTDDPVAYDLLIQALGVERNIDALVDIAPEDDPKITLLQQAVERDPGYALAWAQLARAWNGLAFATDSGADWARYVSESEAAAQKAVTLDPDLAMAHNALGWVAHRRGERLEAERHFRKALEIDANELGAMSGLSLQIGWKNPEEALALLDRSISIDPKSAITQRQRHFFLFSLGRLDEAVAALLTAIELEPDDGVYYNDLYDLYELQGRPDEGARLVSRLLRRSPGSFTGQMAMAEAWMAAADFEHARRWTELLLRERPGSDEGKLLEVERLISAHRHEEALELLSSLADSRVVDWQLRAWASASCLAVNRLECARRESIRYRELLEDNALRGERREEFYTLAALFDLLLRERQGSDPVAVVDLERMQSTFATSRFFGNNAHYLNAGLSARMGRPDEAYAHLAKAIGGPDGAVFNTDLLGFTPEHSLLLDPLRTDPAFAEWMAAYQARRDAMLERMQDLESRGEIVRPAAIGRMTGP